MIRLLKRLRQALRREDGTASVEFVLVIPVIMSIFMASFESGLFMTRSIMLDQAVDRTMRELRLGRLVNPTQASLKTEICSRTVIMPDCQSSILVELRPISTATWTYPDTNARCRDRAAAVEPIVDYTQGSANEIMLVRVCVVMDALFPTTGIALNMSLDSQGGYALVSTAVFTNEP